MRVLFRFKPNDKKAWVGFTEGETWEDIFWAIDEYGDPNETAVIKLPHKYPMGFCVPFTNDGDEGWSALEEDREIAGEFYESMPDIDGPEWETKQAKEWREYIVDGPYTGKKSDEPYD
jgi:hypothetical protein|tara:strand:+ start:539 stop:892 length:354 start_codon:yes stop_codon:yes gene_type:complete